MPIFIALLLLASCASVPADVAALQQQNAQLRELLSECESYGKQCLDLLEECQSLIK